MLKIALGSEYVEKWLSSEELKRYRGSCKSYYKSLKKPEWFRNDFARRVIREIDRAEIILDYAVRLIEYDNGYSVDSLSGGAKTLISMYNARNYIFLAQMGENCIDFLEEIAADYEKEGKDLIIVSNWLMDFNFKYIKEVYFINWDKTCYNQDEINDDIFPLWYQQERAGRDEDDNTPTQDEIDAMDRLLKSLGIEVETAYIEPYWDEEYIKEKGEDNK